MQGSDIIEIIGISISFLLGSVSLILAIMSNINSKKSNNIAEQANRLSEEALNVSKNLEKEQNEFVSTTNNSNVRIIENKDIEFIDKNSICDYLLVFPIELTNKSSLPVAVNRPSFYWGNNGDYYYVNEEDFFYPKNIPDIPRFPVYLKAKEIKDINVVLGISASDRMMYYSKNGMTLEFRGTKNTYKRYISASNVIDLNK